MVTTIERESITIRTKNLDFVPGINNILNQNHASTAKLKQVTR